MSATTVPPAGMQNPLHPYSNQAALPPNFSHQDAQNLFQQYKQLRSQGVQENDPTLLKIRNQLHAIQQHTQLQRAREQGQQNIQPPPPYQNGDGQQRAPNGVTQPPQPSVDFHPQVQADGSAGVDGSTSQQQGSKASSQLVLTDEQKQLLRNQMLAFKILSRNAPLPPEVQRIIFPSQQEYKSPTPNQLLDAAGEVVGSLAESGAPSTVTLEPEKIEAPKSTGYETFPEKYNRLKQAISYAQHGDTVKMRPRLSGVLPPGVDVDRVRQERERIVFNQMQTRKTELEKLGANMISWNTNKSTEPQPDGELKLKALLEYKMLCLLPKQRHLRQQISREMVHADSLAMTANRALYRREKKPDIREARFTEKFEKDQRNARELQEKKKHNNYLESILRHAEEVQRAAKENRGRIQRIGRLMVNHQQTIEREEQKRIERTAKQRLQALKANDEETYLKLLGQAKDSRISHLLKQTDSFLDKLAASVKTQQQSSNDRWGNRRAISEEPDSDRDMDEDDEDQERIDYYEVAHRVKEKVEQQSNNLIGGSLKEYQLKGLQWMISLYNNSLNGILADEMGLGKTIQTISLVTYLIEKKGQMGPFVIVVPLSTLINWNNEFEKWAPSVQRIVYKGPPTVRKVLWPQIRSQQFQVMLTTYEFIIKDRHVLSRIKWLYMIVDEGHRMKNTQSKLSTVISQYYQTRFRLILTGTPLQNNLPELWALLNFVLPNIFKSVKTFDEWFNTPFANTGGQDKMDLTEEEQLLVIRRLHKVLRPFLLRRLKKDVETDLPDKQERVVKCGLSSVQTRLYGQLMNHNKLFVGDGKGGKMGMRGLSNMLMQLRKLCNHPFVFEEVEDQLNPNRLTNDMLWRTAGKFELLDRILPKFKATGHRVLLFFQMTQIMNIMEDFMRLRGFSYLRLDGSTKADERAELLKQFNEEGSDIFCFLLSTRAGGLGLNLQSADTVIIYDSDWNPHQDLQAQDRAHRIGQKNEVRILRLISSHSIEEKILERANWKLDMDGKVIQAGKFDNKSTNEEREAMLRVMLESADAVENMEQDEMDDEDLNMIMMRHPDELEVFARLDAERNADPIYGPGKKLPRLLGDNELPEIWMTEDTTAVEEAQAEESYGRGARERTRVRYDDGLNEAEWLLAVDDDNDTIEAAMARKEAKQARRAANKEKKLRTENGPGDSPLPDQDSSENESPAPKQPAKRGRKPKIEKRKADEASLDGDSAPVAPPPRKRGRQAKVQETLSVEQRAAVQEILDKIYDTLMDLEEPAESDELEPRPLIDPFINLPDRHSYWDYYQYIRNPICMEQIKKKINRKEYQSLRAFADDIILLCTNCRTYNEDGSLLYQDANVIEEKTFDMLRAESAVHAAELGSAAYSDDDGGADMGGGRGFGSSTNGYGMASASSTPAPATQKLKLNLGGAKSGGTTTTGTGSMDEDD